MFFAKPETSEVWTFYQTAGAKRLLRSLPTMILITGAAGKTGRAIIQALTKRGETVRALVHRSDQTASIKALGVDDVIVGNLLDQSVIRQAVQDVRAVYHIAPNVSPDEVSIGRTIIAAAQTTGVGHFVFHSVLHPQIEAMPHHWRKMRVEELLFASGLPFTILQPTAYMQNILAHWDQIIEKGRYPIPYSTETRLSLVDLEDVADAAAIVLTEPRHIGATIELVGTPPMSQREIADSLADPLGHPVEAEVVSLEEWERVARASGLGDYQVLTLLKMFCYYESHGFAGNPNALSCLLGRQPTSFAEFVERIKNDHRIG
ncbi:MAG: NmrA/HSCARG family protein [Chloroflexi bacterium]|nr:NmrA/HSCARG family protein [Chloroflexota bacterium]